ncbi:MAG: C25 family cysteine peptidase [Bacteroidales bacterium]|nr:C25 family cysteine peptidase [Bacteroidales bacterium]
MKKITLSLVLFLTVILLNAQTIEKTYYVDNHDVKSIEGYVQIELKDCMQSALAGQPTLPWHSVTLLLPQGTKAESMEVEMSDFQELNGDFQLFPYQPSRTYNDLERTKFYKDEAVYSSKSVYPAENHGVLTTQYVNGYSVAVSSFTPVKYVPSEGKVLIAKTVNIKINTCKDEKSDPKMLSSRPQIISKVKSLVQNPEMLDSYVKTDEKSLQGYELLVITPEQYVSNFDNYVQFYCYHDIRTDVVSVESIYSSMQGVDNQEKIRNFIIQEYQDNDILMVLLGGDVALVPFRGFYCDVLTGGSHNTDNGIPADLYYSGLDGTWNDNGNDRWGEPGEDDLYPEIGIARMPFNNETQLANILNKIVKYQQIPVLGEFRTIVLGGEKLYDYPYTQGSQYLELLIGEHDDNGYTTVGIDENYDFVRLYDEDGNWSGTKLRNAINAGCGYVHHAGHANSDYVAGWYGSSVSASFFAGANGVDHNFTFFHSHGCDCAAFDQGSIMERLVTIENFAVSVIGNSRYGWFNEGQTEGPSCHLQREMTDAFWNERIPYLGIAFSEGKCQTAPWVTAPGQYEEGALRWNFYDLNILGDVAVCPWHDEPFEAAVRFRPAMLQGETVNEIYVSHNGQPLKNFRCSIFYYEEKLGEAVTDETGNAIVTLSRPVDFVDQLSLAVTGMNSFPQSRVIECIDDNTTFVKPYKLIANDEDGDGKIEPGENVSFDLVLKNWGGAPANDIHASAQCCAPEYFRFTNTEADLQSIDALSVDTIYDAFGICMDQDVPNGWPITLNITSNDATGYWYNSFGFKASAPDIQILAMSAEELDGNGNGVVEPGESGLLSVYFKNFGSVIAENTELNVEADNELVTIETSTVSYPQIQENEEVTAEFVFHVDENVPNSTIVKFNATAQCGKYVSSLTYTMTVGYLMDDFETGDFSKLEWESAGDKEWLVTDSDAYEGTFSARSGIIDDDEITSLIINVEVIELGNLSFYFKTSTEERHDYLVFYIDGDMKDRWSGEMDWQLKSYNLNSGKHELEWRYDKSISGQAGLDAVFIDNVTFPINSTIIMDIEEDVDNQCDVMIHPNPSNGRFVLNLDDNQNVVKIFNSLGQMVYENENASQSLNVDISEKETGIYLININGKTQKLIKK